MNEHVETLSQKNVFRRLLVYLKPHRKTFFIALLVLFAATACEVTGPILIKIFIDQHLTARNFDPASLTLLAAGFVLLSILAALFNYYQLFTFQKVALNVIQKMRIDVFSRVQHLSLSFFDRTPGGSLVSRITNDTEAIKELYVGVLSAFLQNTVFLFGIFIGMFILNVRLAAFCLVLIPLLVSLMYVYRRRSGPVYRLSRERLSRVNANLNESLAGMNIIQAFRREKQMRQNFAALNGQYRTAMKKTILLNGLLLRPAVDFIYFLTLVLILGFFGLTSLKDPIEIGTLYAFINYLDRFFEPVNMMMMQLGHFQQAIASAERVFGLLDETDQAIEKIGGEKARITKGHVAFHKVSFSYDGKTNVLEDISFTAPPGKTVAIVGHTGSGKSSIANLLMRFYPVNSGSIEIDGQPIEVFSNQELRNHIGLVLQDPFLFTGNVRQNIRLGNEQISDETVREAAQFVQADTFIEKLPRGYDEPVGERGSAFSSGERQLISFARTMARKPKVLVLDEATASIDSETEEAIQKALLKMRKGRTTIVIAHRLATVQDADEILVLHRGKVVERGTHQTLLEKRGLYYKMYLLQKGGKEVTQ